MAQNIIYSERWVCTSFSSITSFDHESVHRIEILSSGMSLMYSSVTSYLSSHSPDTTMTPLSTATWCCLLVGSRFRLILYSFPKL